MNDNPKRDKPVHDDATRFSSAEELDGGDGLAAADDHDFELFEASAAPAAGPLGVLGEYLLLQQIGVGGMGRVYRAEHRTMNRQVALKVLSSEIAGNAELLEQFFSEIRAVGKMMHPNIVTAFDAGSIGDRHYLVMELVEGEVLSARMREHGPLSGSEAAHLLEQAALALSYAHKLGIVHRDIKPSNMMLTPEGTLKILDFGLAHLGSRAPGLAKRNIFMGTPEFMSPEQIENADAVDGRSDLYSLGATLFYLLTGRAMFQGEKMQVAKAQLRQKPEALYVVRNDIDLRLDAVFQRLVAKSPAARYASADALLQSLAQLNLTSPASKPGPLALGSGRLRGDQPTSIFMNHSTLAKKSQVVAIDLGMLVSTAAYCDANLGPQLIHQGEGNAQHLRNMWWSSGRHLKMGSEAITQRQAHPEQVIHSLQRWIGVRELSWSLAGRRAPPEVGLAALLRQIMAHAASVTDGSDTAVVTVPACYDQLHRRAIRNACRMAGINLVQLLDKPLAAALAWLDVHARLGSSQEPRTAIDSKLLVLHLGGSALEASVIHAGGMEVRQLGVSGSWKMGILRWQGRLTEYFVARLQEDTGKSIRSDVAAATRLQRTVELAMDRLTRSPRVEIKFEWQGITLQQTITHEGLLKIAPELAQAIEQVIRQACQHAKVDVSEIDHILLAGAMTRMRVIRDIVKQCVPHETPVSELEKADIARGAALQAQHYQDLTQHGGLQPKALGCSAYDFALLAAHPSSGKATPRLLLEKSSPLPIHVTRTLRPTALSGSESNSFPSLQIIEGTSLGESNWLALGRVKPDELFPDRGSDDPLQLRLEIDESGILETSLRWTEGNRQIRLPHTSDPTLSEQSIQSWREWLESTLLCTGL